MKSELQKFMIVQSNKPTRTNFLAALLAMLRIPTRVKTNPHAYLMGGWVSIRPSAYVIYQYKTSIVRGLAHYRVGPSLIRG